ncbi:MAG: hypothetical protein EXX96DRAFT_109187 [Benjaminiella poitrasii]|nr:MAG: hypothetical protein EXX96DRAFT_109187 [Benjaminiella poitrasii]
MAAINDDVYARVREKIKENNLSEQEVNAIDTAREQLQTHTYTGGLIGVSTGFFLGKRKKLNPFQMLALTGGGFLMGFQMGLISGALAGIKTINRLPNPQRIISLIREVQLESVKGRLDSNGNGPAKQSQRTPSQNPYDIENPQEHFSPDLNENTSGDAAWSNNRTTFNNLNGEGMHVPNETDPLSRRKISSGQQQQQQQQQTSLQPSAWDKIRAENLPNNTWAKIRMESQKNRIDSVDIEKARAERARRLHEGSVFELNGEEIPRTREEEALQKGGALRRNQWGDSLE